MFPNFRLTARFSVAMLFLVNGVLFGTIIPRLAEYQHALDLTKAEIGFALLGIAGGSIAMFPLAPVFMRWWGSAYVSWVSAFIMITGILPLAFAASLPGLIFTLLWIGIGNGLMDIAMNMQAVEAEKKMGRSFISQMHGFWSVGSVVGAGFVAVAAWGNIGFVPHFFTFALIAVLAVLIVKDSLVETPVVKQQKSAGWTWPSRPLVVIGLIGLVAALSESTSMDWSTIYLAEFMDVGSPWTVAGFIAFSSTMVIGRFSGDFVIERYAMPTLVLGSSVLVFFGYLSFLVYPGMATFILGYALAGLGISVLAPLMYGAGARDTTRPPGAGLAFVTALGYGGFVIGPPLFGIVAGATSLRLALCAIPVLMALQFVLSTQLKRNA